MVLEGPVSPCREWFDQDNLGACSEGHDLEDGAPLNTGVVW